jgi:nitrite reductase [NAD(P)H] small subunit
MSAPGTKDLDTWNEVCLGPIEAIPLGEGRAFVVGDTAIAVFRPRDGSLYATQNRCPHLDGPLADGLLGAGSVLCPLHAYRFDLQTGACGNDPACRIRTFPVRAQEGTLFLTVEQSE